MAKQCFEQKKVVKLIGILDRDEDNRLIVSVEDRDGRITEYLLTEVLDELVGSLISIQSEDIL